MQISSDPKQGQLTYCTNIHAGEAWSDVEASLREHLPLIKAQVAPTQSLGVGLRLGAAATASLRDAAAFDGLCELLSGGYHVFTINGFPYGAFHGQPVKDGAYRPDWSEPERLAYSNELAEILVRLLPAGMTGSISTVPCTFKPWLEARNDGERVVDAAIQNLLEHAAYLWRLAERTGKEVVLALEPEPYCLLETIAETVAFFETRLFGSKAVSTMQKSTGLSAPEAERALRTHLGVCYDVCHAAVEFEDPAASVAALQQAGISIAKVQLSSALRIAEVDAAALDALQAFDEPVYLHQTMAMRDGQVQRFPDLAPALARGADAFGEEWRSHFHVPVFLADMQAFGTTQAFLRDILKLHAEAPISAQLEVETYTWDVLPPQFRNVAVSDAISREMSWVLDTLRA